MSKLGVPRPRVVLVDSGCGDRLRSRLVEKYRYLVVGCSVPELDIWFDATWTSASSRCSSATKTDSGGATGTYQGTAMAAIEESFKEYRNPGRGHYEICSYKGCAFTWVRDARAFLHAEAPLCLLKR